mgnify:CR=1 FL=1
MNKTLAQRLLARFNLISKVLSIHKLSGGRQHEAFKIQLIDGNGYVIKRLNFECYLGTYSNQHFDASEQYADYVNQHLGGALTAFSDNGQSVVVEQTVSYLIYPWCDGNTKHVLNARQAKRLGQYLRKMHALPAISLPLKGIPFSPFKITLWSDLVNMGHINQVKLNELIQLAKQCEQSRLMYDGERLLSHQDINLDNILWRSETQPILIDWESAGYISPYVDLLGLALNVGGIGAGNLDLSLVKVTIKAYLKNHKQKQKMTPSLYLQSYATWFAWLDYCLSSTIIEAELQQEEIKLTLIGIDLLAANKIKIFGYFNDAQ